VQKSTLLTTVTFVRSVQTMHFEITLLRPRNTLPVVAAKLIRIAHCKWQTTCCVPKQRHTSSLPCLRRISTDL